MIYPSFHGYRGDVSSGMPHVMILSPPQTFCFPVMVPALWLTELEQTNRLSTLIFANPIILFLLLSNLLDHLEKTPLIFFMISADVPDKLKSKDPQSYLKLCQKISVKIQHLNSVSVLGCSSIS